MAWTGKIDALWLTAALTAGIMIVGTTGSGAGQRKRDYAYADSYGNLIVYSRAGYKRIVVGQGHLAAELNEYGGGVDSEPNVVRLNDRYNLVIDCYRPPVLLKGRSYMYGLADGELPEPSGNCRD
jgi:hypothetical protein